MAPEANGTAVTTGKVMTLEELNNVQGRAWEDVDVSSFNAAQESRHCALIISAALKFLSEYRDTVWGFWLSHGLDKYLCTVLFISPSYS